MSNILLRIMAIAFLTLGAFSVVHAEVFQVPVEDPIRISAIQDAVDGASASAGDTVFIPAGVWEFTGTEQITVPDGINLQGAGPGQTILSRQSIDPCENFAGAFFLVKAIQETSGNPFSISGFTFKGVGTAANRDHAADDAAGSCDHTHGVRDFAIKLHGKLRNFQVYNNRFEGFSAAAIEVRGRAYGAAHGHPVGVIYQNEFYDLLWVTPDHTSQSYGYGVVLYGDD